MAVTEGFKDFVRDLLVDFGPVTIRNMFGGAGIYADGVMFAILVDDTLYLKADEASRRAFETEGMGPFTYEPAGKGPVAMPYGRYRRVYWRSRKSSLRGRAKPIVSRKQERRNRRASGADAARPPRLRNL
jgi:DNA transformation protein